MNRVCGWVLSLIGELAKCVWVMAKTVVAHACPWVWGAQMETRWVGGCVTHLYSGDSGCHNCTQIQN